MVQMGDREACDRVIHNLNGAACFGSDLSIRFDVSLQLHCYSVLLCCFHCYAASATNVFILSDHRLVSYIMDDVASPCVLDLLTASRSILCLTVPPTMRIIMPSPLIGGALSDDV